MRRATPGATRRPRLILLALCVLAPTGQAALRTVSPAEFSHLKVTCEIPVRLTHDCSVWQGATRPIAFGDFRMTLAADSNGSTILVTQLRPRPDHNGGRFGPAPGRQARLSRARAAIDEIGAALEDRGIRLERVRTVHHGPGVAGYFLEFSDNAYDYLRQFTVLESEHWLPQGPHVR